MNFLTQFAADSYNCAGTADNAYGAGDFGTCETTGTVGVPNTGLAMPMLGGVSFDIILPIAAAVIATAVSAVFATKKRKKANI